MKEEVVMRDYIILYINGKEHRVRGSQVFLPISDYLRYGQTLTGTKIVCAEGDCGACSILKAFPNQNGEFSFSAVNSCISPLYLYDGSHVITIEGLKNENGLHPVQEAMVAENGSQCGFCTPGFVVALTAMFEEKTTTSPQKTKNALTGNLCRCTGYHDIIKAALTVDTNQVKKIKDHYQSKELIENLLAHKKQAVHIRTEERELHIPVELEAALPTKDQRTRIVSGATDLGVQFNKEKIELEKVLSLHLIDELYQIGHQDNQISVGAKVTISQFQNFVAQQIPEVDNFLNIFASPQIKNVATLVGNIANASPIADTTPFLMALDTIVDIASSKGRRQIALKDFYRGYKDLDLKDDEIILRILISVPENKRFFKNYKVSQRRDLDISCLNSSFLFHFDETTINQARVVYGGVGPTTLRLPKMESYLEGKKFCSSTVEGAKKLLLEEISPISDARGSDRFRKTMALNLFDKFFHEWEVSQ